jgi:hypothetical protein
MVREMMHIELWWNVRFPLYKENNRHIAATARWKFLDAHIVLPAVAAELRNEFR